MREEDLVLMESRAKLIRLVVSGKRGNKTYKESAEKVKREGENRRAERGGGNGKCRSQ